MPATSPSSTVVIMCCSAWPNSWNSVSTSLQGTAGGQRRAAAAADANLAMHMHGGVESHLGPSLADHTDRLWNTASLCCKPSSTHLYAATAMEPTHDTKHDTCHKGAPEGHEAALAIRKWALDSVAVLLMPLTPAHDSVLLMPLTPAHATLYDMSHSHTSRSTS
jgi:hypothetical protein